MGRDKKKAYEIRTSVLDELQHFFPGIFYTSSDMQFFMYEKDRVIAIIDLIINPEDEEARNRLTIAMQMIATLIKPKKFDEKKNFEIEYENNFEKTCIMLSQHTNKDVKQLTVREYFALIEYVKEKNRTK